MGLAAKRIRHDSGDPGSWLDFHLAYGGFSGTLKDIRKAHYIGARGSVLFRPYALVPQGEQSFDSFIRNARALKYRPDDTPNFPNLKLKELRDVVFQGEESGTTFVEEQKARGRSLPAISGHQYGKTLFEESRTPYFDMLEVLELYPDFALRQAKEDRA